MENGDSARFLNKFEYRKAYMSTWKELTIYVHGITPERDVKSHNATYDKIHTSINKELKKLLVK